jgi:SAM-dependent methyltransferase
MVQAHDARQLVTYAADNCDALALMSAPETPVPASLPEGHGTQGPSPETIATQGPTPEALVHYWHRDLAQDLREGAAAWRTAGPPDLTLDTAGRPTKLSDLRSLPPHTTRSCSASRLADAPLAPNGASDSAQAVPFAPKPQLLAALDTSPDVGAPSVADTYDERYSPVLFHPGSPLPPEPVDLAVCFGFMHHLPLPERRAELLRVLVHACAPGGVVAVSFWQLSHSPKLLAKAQRTTAAARATRRLPGLGPRDYLLGCQDRSDVLRFVHDFSESEIDELAAVVSDHAVELARFSADGASGDLNRYLVLRRSRS